MRIHSDINTPIRVIEEQHDIREQDKKERQGSSVKLHHLGKLLTNKNPPPN